MVSLEDLFSLQEKAIKLNITAAVIFGFIIFLIFDVLISCVKLTYEYYFSCDNLVLDRYNSVKNIILDA